MIINQKYLPKHIKTSKHNINYGNRGMDFESLINKSNLFYLENHIAVITKRPTPIKILKVDYSKNKITSACFEKHSTTDYNGVYKGHYIDFDAKSTLSKTSFPLANISIHQINHLKNILAHHGIAFLLIYFKTRDEYYFIDFSIVLDFINHYERKSLPILYIKEKGIQIPFENSIIDYIQAIDEYYHL